MKAEVVCILRRALDKAVSCGDLPPCHCDVVVEYPDRRHGDYATNLAFVLARKAKKSPREVAEVIARNVDSPYVERVEVAGPGFINLTMKGSWWEEIVKKVIRDSSRYGSSTIGGGRRVQVEFVSANPTGPLHVGHGRGAAVGDSLCRILEKAGYKVEREYYINDAGRQIRLLGESILARCKELRGLSVSFPEDGYCGEYVVELAREALELFPDILDVPEEEAIRRLAEWGKDVLLERIVGDLERFNVTFDNFFSEKSLHEKGEVKAVIELLKEKGLVYEKDGALWFSSTQFGDEKDRVVVRSDGEPTYFAADIAYHKNKMERGYDLCINVWGADHHGYIPRVKAALKALGYDTERLKVMLIQMVSLSKGGKPVAMSKREGELIPLSWLVEQVGVDAARFIFLTRKCDAHLDFDIEVATKKTEENPVFYVQYAHARICSIERIADERGIELNLEEANLSLLKEEEERELMRKLAQFPDVVEASARSFEPHRVSYYLSELASLFHGYYNRYRVLVEDVSLRNARFALCQAVRVVLREGLRLLGVSAPEVM